MKQNYALLILFTFTLLNEENIILGKCTPILETTVTFSSWKKDAKIVNDIMYSKLWFTNAA